MTQRKSIPAEEVSEMFGELKTMLNDNLIGLSTTVGGLSIAVEDMKRVQLEQSKQIMALQKNQLGCRSRNMHASVMERLGFLDKFKANVLESGVLAKKTPAPVSVITPPGTARDLEVSMPTLQKIGKIIMWLIIGAAATGAIVIRVLM